MSIIPAKRPLKGGAVTNEIRKRSAKPITEFFKKSTATASETRSVQSTTNPGPTATLPLKTVSGSLSPSEFKSEFVKTLTAEQKVLLNLEITTMEDSWFKALHREFTKPYFLTLKRFLQAQAKLKISVFPSADDTYSWSRLTPLAKVKAVILGQDPYHNVNQAHGLAFSVKQPTPPPPSLKNIYKALKIDYPDFVTPTGPNAGDLTKWAKQGVLLLNTCLTVKAHEANSHAKRGWEQFTEEVLRVVINDSQNKIVLLLWGTPAQKRISNIKIDSSRVYVLKSVHPSPLSASRGYFNSHHFVLCNKWLIEHKESPIDWALASGNIIDYYS